MRLQHRDHRDHRPASSTFVAGGALVSPPHPRAVTDRAPGPLTVQRLGSSTVAADVFDLLHERRVVVVALVVVVVVCGGWLRALFAEAVAGLHPGLTEGPPPLWFLLLGRGYR